MLDQFLSMFTFIKCKKVLQFVMRNDFPSFLTCIFCIFPFFTPGKQPYFEISEMTTHTPCARDIWWTLGFASAFPSPGVNSRTELVPSPLARGLSLWHAWQALVLFWHGESRKPVCFFVLPDACGQLVSFIIVRRNASRKTKTILYN
jgi:hypothetical protein